jgi:uncharacterized protein YlxP (DUF503 family)
MTVGLVQLALSIPASRSLKGKRRVLKSIKDRARSKFNVSIAEVDEQDAWDRSVLAVCCVSNDVRRCNEVLSKVVNLVESDHESDLLRYHIEMM